MPALLDDRAHEWTAAEVRRLRERAGPGVTFECVDGELLVSPGPSITHERAFMRLVRRLADYVDGPPRIGETLGSRSDLILDTKTLVQPDVFVAPLVNGRRPESLEDCKRFLLIVEVLSPNSKRADRLLKRRKYQRVADEYWVVDTDERRIERWTPSGEWPELLTTVAAWHPDGRTVPLTIDLPDFFRDAHGQTP
ncbi:MAG: Uma2 family endonuclease [Gemmatimonadota bacterium]|nr:Uma2 family endonuclease [Gemmatimonadota bacterium]